MYAGWVRLGVLLALLVCASVSEAAPKREPSMRHGLAQIIGGVLFELPKTTIDATLTNPPVVGTAVGLFAGTIRALQTTLSGVIEVAQAFKPWGF